MKIDIKESEKTAALLLSGASTFILNTMATLEDHIDALAKEYQKIVKERDDLKKEVDNLQAEINKLDTSKSESNL